MERKYYLRGLGIGILVTAIIMGIALPGKQTMTDEEVIARAKELGMVENTLLSEEEAAAEDAESDAADTEDTAGEAAEDTAGDSAAEKEDEESAEDAAESSTAASALEKESGNEAAAVQDETGGDAAAGSAAEEEITEASEETVAADITSAAVKTITVTNGDGSYTVAKKLADAGVVTSAENFDTYLCQNGYDKKLRTGTFSIPADASDEQIARIVTGAE